MLLAEGRQVQMSWSAHRTACSRMSATLAWNLEISLDKRASQQRRHHQHATKVRFTQDGSLHSFRSKHVPNMFIA